MAIKVLEGPACLPSLTFCYSPLPAPPRCQPSVATEVRPLEEERQSRIGACSASLINKAGEAHAQASGGPDPGGQPLLHQRSATHREAAHTLLRLTAG